MTPAETLTAYREAMKHERTWEIILLDPRTTPAHEPTAKKYYLECKHEREALEKQLTAILENKGDTTP